MASGPPPHVLKMWLAVSNGMLCVKNFCSCKAFFVSVEFNGDHKTTDIDEVKSVHSLF